MPLWPGISARWYHSFMERTDAAVELAGVVVGFVGAAQRGMTANFDLARVSVLTAVAAEGPLRPREVGKRVGMAPSSVTRHVQALEDAGQLSVEPDPEDHRTCLLEVTEAGRGELATLRAVGGAVLGEVVADWSQKDISTLSSLLQRLLVDWEERGEQARGKPAPDRRPRWRHPVPGQEKNERKDRR
ncbi:MarR family winged helix-turn-helix transcriptional regulator [Streptomyces sp. SID13031]|uniref:MarR family winged helix-turn-helix transcriptional regulator n=1 Tax=Streptomyces sp. SID13031 TaxID=2706046 RepID=UPI0013C94E09|nr:MarR family winged helix-turn-helix transcriptional regulator [Streptomyces sp. SID13031]NEA35647.1 winged helix-turn-helix transcriptional regulator [Streptomyces sp. SID13031]